MSLKKRFAPVVPLNIAEQLLDRNLLGGYHLLLAHDILAHQSRYEVLAKNIRARYSDSLIIMDNSLIELGHALQATDLMSAASIVNADYIIVPDALSNSQLTIDMAAEFLDTYSALAFKNQRPLMGVVQGHDMWSCTSTFLAMRELGIKAFAVPRVIVEHMGSRQPLLEWLQGYDYPIHLLGFSDNIEDDLKSCRYCNVMGIDSAVPIRAGLGKQLLDVQDTKASYGTRGDYWNWRGAIPTPQWVCVEYNLRYVNNYIQPIDGEYNGMR